MQTRPIGRTGLKTGIYSLGTMTFGTQTPEADAHRQLDMAVEAGMNLIDTAELYPVNPIAAETCGDSEAIVGNWLAASGVWVPKVMVPREKMPVFRPVRPIGRVCMGAPLCF
jgi:aryl-alcohol dehydrogenase-like predicted oxidoreductase